MRIVPTALGVAALAAGLATAVFAQTTTPPPANPNTKVYAYKKTAPQPTNPEAYAGSLNPQPGRVDPDIPPYGSQTWWQEKDRNSHGASD